MTALVATDVLIDILRGTPAAQAWLTSMPAATFAIPGVVAMELLIGCRNQAELRRVQQFLNAFSQQGGQVPEQGHEGGDVDRCGSRRFHRLRHARAQLITLALIGRLAYNAIRIGLAQPIEPRLHLRGRWWLRLLW